MDEGNKQGKKRGKFYITPRRIIFCALLLVFIAVGAVAVYNLVIIEARYAAAQSEYDELRQFAPAGSVGTRPTEPAPPRPSASAPEVSDESAVPGDGSETGLEALPAPVPEVLPLDLAAINPDFVGWLRVEGTNIDYPVVQGKDNYRYLNTTFRGGRNNSGTIFMDSECTDGFFGIAVLHGHNMKDGSMFAELHRFRDRSFRDTHTEAFIFLPDGEVLVFNIFDVRLTDAFDEIFELPEKENEAVEKYFADFDIRGGADGGGGADTQDKTGILVLSTCTDGDRNERLLVIGYLQP